MSLRPYFTLILGLVGAVGVVSNYPNLDTEPARNDATLSMADDVPILSVRYVSDTTAPSEDEDQPHGFTLPTNSSTMQTVAIQETQGVSSTIDPIVFPSMTNETQGIALDAQENQTAARQFQELVIEDNEGISQFLGYVSSCHTTNSSIRLCSCESVCTIQDSCCFDSDFVGIQAELTSPDESEYQCLSNFNTQWLVNSPSLLMIACPPEWPNNDVREKCAKASSTDPFRNTPCYSTITGVTYKNVYCALCNEESELIPWSANFQCAHPQLLDEIDSLEKMNRLAERPLWRKGCQFVVSPTDQTPVPYCIPSTINDCDQKSNDTDFLTSACLAYFNPVVSSNGAVHRNIHCLRCNTDEEYRQLPSHGQKAPSAVMSALLSASPMVVIRTQNKELSGCKLGESLSLDAGCQPLLSAIRGLTTNFTINVAVLGLSNATEIVLAGRIAEREIRRQLNVRLRVYHPKIIIRRAATILANQRHIAYRIFIYMLEEIPFDRIYIIERAAESIEFSLDFENVLRLTCCDQTPEVPDTISSAGSESNPKAKSSAPTTVGDGTKCSFSNCTSHHVKSGEQQVIIPHILRLLWIVIVLPILCW